MESLLNSINPELTNITVINNRSKPEVEKHIDALLEKGLIDKHVKYKINYGKVYTVLSEVRGVYEPFVTVSDADVFFFPQWFEKSMEIFQAFKKAGVVTPLPQVHLAFYHNVSLFSNIFVKKRQGKVVSDEDLHLFAKSVGNFDLIKKWTKRQYYLQKREVKACIGASHFVATYRTNLLRKLPLRKTEFVFKNGDETFFIDEPIDRMGYYRLSLCKTYAYHMGNTVPVWIDKNLKKTNKKFFSIKTNMNKHYNVKPYFFYKIKKIIYRILKKLVYTILY